MTGVTLNNEGLGGESQLAGDAFETVVVGAGMLGSAAAKYLSQAGLDVLIVGPAEPEPGKKASQNAFGAHFDEARITRRLGWDEVWENLDALSQGRFDDIEQQSGIHFSHGCGSLAIFATSIASRTEAMLNQAKLDGIEVERLTENELQRAFPELALLPIKGGVEGLMERNGVGYLNPRQLVKAQLKLAQAAGAALWRAEVTSIHKESDEWRLRVQDGEQTHEIRAERVLVATGALTNYNNVLPEGHQLDISAFTEPNLLFEVDKTQLSQFEALPTVVTVDPEDTGNDNMSVYMVPPIRYPDGKWYMRMGPAMQPIVRELHSAAEMVAWYQNQSIMPDQRDFIERMMKLLVPNLQPVSVQSAACIIEKTPSRYPYIGHINNDETFTVAVGGNGHGARGSDEIGRLASTVVAGKPWDSEIDQEVFAPIPAPKAGSSKRPAFLKPPFGLC